MAKYNYFSLFFTLLFIISTKSVFSLNYQSAPECPSKDSNEIWLLDENNACQKVNTQGSCGENMLFFIHPNREEKKYGFCDCFDAAFHQEEIEFINNRELSGCVSDIRSQIYVPERNRCFSAFDQGPCGEGKWLVLNESHYPVCAKTPCPSALKRDPLSLRFKFSHSSQDKCYETMTRGFCPKSYKLMFSPNDWIPKCRFAPSNGCPPESTTAAKVLRSRCKPGSRRDYLSKCSRSVNPR